MTFLAGPTVAYKNYDNFITGANFTQASNNKVSNDNLSCFLYNYNCPNLIVHILTLNDDL